MDQSETDIRIDIRQPVTSDECVMSWRVIILGLFIQNSSQVSPNTIIILSPQLWLLWIKSNNI